MLGQGSIEEAKSLIPGGIQHNLANNYPFALNCIKSEVLIYMM